MNVENCGSLKIISEVEAGALFITQDQTTGHRALATRIAPNKDLPEGGIVFLTEPNPPSVGNAAGPAVFTLCLTEIKLVWTFPSALVVPLSPFGEAAPNSAGSLLVDREGAGLLIRDERAMGNVMLSLADGTLRKFVSGECLAYRGWSIVLPTTRVGGKEIELFKWPA